MNNTLLYALAVPLLSASGGLAALNLFGRSKLPQWLLPACVALALVFSGLALFRVLFQADGLHFGFVIGMMCVAWLACLVAFVEGFFTRVVLLEIFVFPVAALVFLVALLLGAEGPLRVGGQAMFQAHLLIALAAYSLLGIAATHAIVMVFQERALHNPAAAPVAQRALRERLLDQLPSLMAMEAILFRQLWAGFVLLSLTLLTGFWFSDQWAGSAWRLDHKTLFALISWVLFAVLLGGRALLGWRGKRALRLCLASFAVLVMAYFGTQFVLEFILKRVA